MQFVTTDSQVRAMGTMSGTGGPPNIPESTAAGTIRLLARADDGTSAYFERTLCIKRSGEIVSLVGKVAESVSIADDEAGDWQCTVDVFENRVRLLVRGDPDRKVTWMTLAGGGFGALPHAAWNSPEITPEEQQHERESRELCPLTSDHWRLAPAVS